MHFFIVLVLSSFVFAEIPSFSDKYYEDFHEGEEATGGFGELDKLIFTYYDINYTMRLLNIYSHSCMLRVENSAKDIQLDETLEFDVDEDDIWDLKITLTDINSGLVVLDFVLNEIEEVPPVENITNTTNTTLTNSTDTNATTTNTTITTNADTNTTSQDDDSDNNPSASSQIIIIPADTDDIPSPDEVTGDVVYNINIDVSLPPGSGIGVLLIVAIILGGLVVYKKVKKKHNPKDKTHHLSEGKNNKKTKNQIPQKPAISKKVLVKKNLKKFIKKTNKSMKLGRQRFAELIAGDDFVRKPKN